MTHPENQSSTALKNNYNSFCSGPLPLLYLCRQSVLKSVGWYNVKDISCLPVPPIIQNFLKTISVPRDFNLDYSTYMSYNIRFAHHPHHQIHQVHAAKCLIDGSDVLIKTQQMNKECRTCQIMGTKMESSCSSEKWEKLKHPNLMNCITIFKSHECDLICYVLDFPLINLQEYIHRCYNKDIIIPEYLLWSTMSKLCSVYHYLQHEKLELQLIEPKNITINRKGEIKLENLLLYLSRDGKYSYRVGVTVTTLYKPPEAFALIRHPNSIVWIIAAIIYELATKKTARSIVPSYTNVRTIHHRATMLCSSSKWDKMMCTYNRGSLGAITRPMTPQYSNSLDLIILSCLNENPSERPCIQNLMEISNSMIQDLELNYHGPRTLLELMQEISEEDHFETASNITTEV